MSVGALRSTLVAAFAGDDPERDPADLDAATLEVAIGAARSTREERLVGFPLLRVADPLASQPVSHPGPR